MARLSLSDFDAASSAIAAAYPELAPQALAGLSAWRDTFDATDDAGASWGSSRLTGDGWPLEMVHTFGVRAAGWTAEIAGTRVPSSERLARAASFTRTPPSIVAELIELQAHSPLSFGAWVGTRYTTLGERRKLYAEVPLASSRAAIAFAAMWSGDEPILATRPATCRIVGYRPDDDTRELYFRIDQLERGELEWIASRAKLPGAGHRLVDMAGKLLDRNLDENLPGLQQGISVASGPDHLCTLTLFLFARTLGSDVGVRQRLVTFANKCGWDSSGYERLAAGSNRTDSRTDHGMLALSIQSPLEPKLAVGIRVRARG